MHTRRIDHHLWGAAAAAYGAPAPPRRYSSHWPLPKPFGPGRPAPPWRRKRDCFAARLVRPGLAALLTVLCVAAGAAHAGGDVPAAGLPGAKAPGAGPSGAEVQGAGPSGTEAALTSCTEAVASMRPWPQAPEEALSYQVAVDGLSVGAVDFKIETVGSFRGQPSVEYRSLFKLDHFWAAMAELTGKAAAVVGLDAAFPTQAMDRYTVGETTRHEHLTFSHGGRHIDAVRRVGGADGRAEVGPSRRPIFAQPVVDFLTAFYMVRRLPQNTAACLTVYGNAKDYVVWLTPHGAERIKTPVGMRDADVYVARWGRLGTPKVSTGHVWLSQTAERVPYRMAIDADRHIEAQLHTYVMGRPQVGLKRPYSDAFD